ncbi:MAG: DUF3153 domain-containing protein [Coleofasciculaceae cyanobacterium]
MLKLAIINVWQLIQRSLGSLRLAGVVMLSCLLLSGCVKYDLGLNFKGQHHGAIVQKIKLGQQLTNFSNSEAQQWLRSIGRRTKQLGGTTERLSETEMLVEIPFANGKELVSKFDQFFNPVKKTDSISQDIETENLPTFQSNLSLVQKNFFLIQRERLSYDLDLQGLGVISANGNMIVSPGSLLDLQFSLETPWGAKSIQRTDNALTPQVYFGGHKLVWQLQPGQINHIEAVFWLPSPLGIGAIVITFLVLGGFYLKYRSFPGILAQASAPGNLPQVPQ